MLSRLSRGLSALSNSRASQKRILSAARAVDPQSSKKGDRKKDNKQQEKQDQKTSFAEVSSGIFFSGVLVAATAQLDSEKSIPLPPPPQHNFFKSLVDEFCKGKGYTFSEPLSDAVYEQLSWLMHNEINSPELRKELTANKLNMEIQRGLTRLYCFDLLGRYDMTDKWAYDEFIQNQEGKATPPVDFCKLRAKVKAMRQDEADVIKVTCILTKSQYADAQLKKAGFTDVPKDSEAFLTWLSENKAALELFPISKILRNPNLLKQAYIPVHGRHIPFTEGSASMTKHLSQINPLWTMRWLTNLMGFKGHEEGAGAIYLNAARYEYFTDCYRLLEINKEAPETVLPLWLKHISDKSELKQYKFNTKEQQLVAHLLSFYGEYLPAAKVDLVVYGFLQYRAVYPKQSAELVEGYNEFVNTPLEGPTYTPAVLHTARGLLEKMSLPQYTSPTEFSVQYTLQLLHQLHQHHDYMKTSILSCRNEAWFKNMEPKIIEWFKMGRPHLSAAVKDGELTCVSEKPELNPAQRGSSAPFRR